MDHPKHPEPVHQGVKPEIRSSHFAVRLVSWILVIGLVGLLAAWWQGHLEWSNGIAEQAMEADPSTPDSESDESGGLTLPTPERDQAPDRLPRISESTVESATSETPADAAQEKPGPLTEETSERSVPEPAAVTSPSTIEEPQPAVVEAAPETPAEEPGAGGETIVNEIAFEFLGPCWVDIRDSTRKFKLFGEMSKGKRKILGGTPPYSVILGNSAMVRITVDGQPFDVESLSRGSVARFTLDPAAVD